MVQTSTVCWCNSNEGCKEKLSTHLTFCGLSMNEAKHKTWPDRYNVGEARERDTSGYACLHNREDREGSRRNVISNIIALTTAIMAEETAEDRPKHFGWRDQLHQHLWNADAKTADKNQKVKETENTITRDRVLTPDRRLSRARLMRNEFGSNQRPNPFSFEHPTSLGSVYGTVGGTSPHLLRHVRNLKISLTVDSAVKLLTFMKFWDLPFTHAETIFFSSGAVSAQIADFIPEVPIQLDSLQVVFNRTISDLDHIDVYSFALYPRDLSHLKALSICDNTGIPWQRFNFETIQLLNTPFPDLAPTRNTPFADLARTEEVEIDLALFPNFLFLRFTPVEVVPPRVLSTVAPVHRIRKIMIDLGRDQSYSGYHDIDPGGKTDCELLDSKLSTLPLRDPPSVKFEVHLGSSEHESAKDFFPGLTLTSQDTLRFGIQREEVSGT
ncbi:hypothetical protein B0H13DRAFT_1883261 [Mycena leptocephala]|nr:hypothetical protein B0H13DRAFT_1883261 [Mycena leptocephala]